MTTFKTNWSAIKQIKNDNPGETITYSVEYEYISNDPNVDDKKRYFVRIILNTIEYTCLIAKEDTAPVGSDQEDFENNYKSNAIEV